MGVPLPIATNFFGYSHTPNPLILSSIVAAVRQDHPCPGCEQGADGGRDIATLAPVKIDSNVELSETPFPSQSWHAAACVELRFP